MRTFWSDAGNASLVILTDFDFTVSQVDVGDLICLELAPPSEETLRRFQAKEIGTRLFWLDSIARADPAQAEALAATVPIDRHFKAFTAWCKSEGIPLAVVSDGFGFYIRRILSREGLGHLPVFCNEMPAPGRLEFPNANPVCDRCSCCKAQVTRRVREGGSRIIYIGDGVSDLYAAGFADWIFAKDRLARFMAERGAPYYPLDSFASVNGTIMENLQDFREGRAPRQSTLRPDSLCKFE